MKEKKRKEKKRFIFASSSKSRKWYQCSLFSLWPVALEPPLIQHSLSDNTFRRSSQQNISEFRRISSTRQYLFMPQKHLFIQFFCQSFIIAILFYLDITVSSLGTSENPNNAARVVFRSPHLTVFPHF